MARKKTIITVVGVLVALLLVIKLIPLNPRSGKVDIVSTISSSLNDEKIPQDLDKKRVVSADSQESIKGGESSSSSKHSDTLLSVHVVGAVNKPGVYRLPASSLIDDAIIAAGGFTEDASYKALNLAALITANSQIYVPTIEEENIPAMQIQQNQGIATDSEDGLVNINTASLEQLQTLTGIGAGKAQDIIDYREQNGGFSKIEDIMNIRGIKQKIFDKFKDQITVS